MPNPYAPAAGTTAVKPGATAPNSSALSAATARSKIPNEGEAGRDGKIVHYEMAGKDPGTGTGILNDVQLPQRSFGSVDDN